MRRQSVRSLAGLMAQNGPCVALKHVSNITFLPCVSSPASSRCSFRFVSRKKH